MSLFSREHYELLAQFEREFKHRRLDKEAKDLWPKGVVFQDGHVNELFLAYRKGHAFGKLEAQQPAGSDVARDAERYRWLRNNGRAAGITVEQYTGSGISNVLAASAMDASIDAALATHQQGGNHG